MKRSNVVHFSSLLVLLFASSHLSAAPIAQWLTPWKPVFDVPDFSGGASAARCFGIGCTTNGQAIALGAAALGLPDTSAFASATVAASSPFLVDANAAGQVIFSRQFLLAGSDTGWDVTFSGAYLANGTASGAGVNSSVSLAAVASVRQQPSLVSPVLGGLALRYTKVLDATVADPSNLNVPITAFVPKTAQLANGTYWVFGQVLATTHVDSAIFSSGVGNGGIGASFTLNATPVVPEPSAAFLLGSGLIAAGILRHLRGSPRRAGLEVGCRPGGPPHSA